MRKRNVIIAATILVLVIGVIIVWNLVPTETTFEDAMQEGFSVEDVTHISTRNANNEQVILDEPQIQAFINVLMSLELKENNFTPDSDSELHTFILELNNNPEYQIDLYSENYVSIYDSSLKGNKTKKYEITNDIDLEAIQSAIQ
ncbi:hypothetical protein PUW24_11625 [Paenibacillus urinalis]|uniref:Uncharacterized protein n=1 Tax=Paenibacillus urinalis TaxID=521520 RepID=A0AAX3N320_9BACL|nr:MULTISPECIES: hypothetical protein [Paenibacillus]WDH83434.1 hypothetical protein PUW23_04095 [Paenibacillus urinalis]WDH99480.1 hypothetical protein PUW24_11625 [Paenibacillus urinalis]WDI03113.1 hypothetical protein PUW25_03770 [Paenibacillus urinalis]GAK41815.1 hypothetical protein TCA2_4307 [Paenibacillus sp. TCA20]